MSAFDSLAGELRAVIRSASPALATLPAASVSAKPDPARWSKLEILGHLIDSACNNHQRFVRAALDRELHFPRYEQEGWARVQAYAVGDWDMLLVLWTTYNEHLANLISKLPPGTEAVSCRIGDGAPVTLRFLVEDYIAHMRHHLRQLLPTAATPGA